MTRKYRHSCVITETKRLEGGEFKAITLYDGPCNYQDAKRSIVSGNVVVTTPRIYLPNNDVLLNSGNGVVITIEKGRIITAEINNVRDKSGEFVNGTKIELKQAK